MCLSLLGGSGPEVSCDLHPRPVGRLEIVFRLKTQILHVRVTVGSLGSWMRPQAF